jgi:hypothetical protein
MGTRLYEITFQVHNQNRRKITFNKRKSFKSETYLLTELSPSWGTINWAATQELPSISWNPKVQYRIHNSPPLVPILSHMNPIQINTTENNVL